MTFQDLKALLTKPIGSSGASGGRVVSPRRKSVPTDVVGVEIGGNDPRGCPAVRIVRRRDVLTVRAFGFVPPPSGALPTSWQELNKQPVWSLPLPFAAPSAALAVVSPDMVVRQTTAESLSDGGAKSIVAGVPTAHDGLRMVVEPMAEPPFLLGTGLPEYQALWLSRLLPEGRRPTACSIQTLPTAMLSVLADQPQFVADGGNAAALFVTLKAMHLVGFRKGGVVLYREFPGVGGLQRIREALKSGFGMEMKMVDEVLDDTLIDPSPILGPVVNPVLRQLELSLDYLKSRLGVAVDKVFLMGLPSGAAHWSRMSEGMLGVKMISPGLFDGVELPPRPDRETEGLLNRSHLFLGAYGAARAVMEDGK